MKTKLMLKTLLLMLVMVLPGMAATITYTDGTTVIFNPNGTVAGINVGTHAGDPSSLNNGDLWYSTSANALRARVNGATASVSLAGHGHVSADVTDASTTPDANKLVKYDGEGDIEGATVTARGQLVTGQTAGAAGEIKFLDGASSFSFLFTLESPMSEDVEMLIPTGEGSEVVLASRNWANARFAVGPAGAADNALARYDATTGRLLQSSQITASDAGALAGVTAVRAFDVAGLELQGTDASVALRVVNSLNSTAFGNWTFDGATANKVAGFNGTKALVPLDTLPAVNGSAVTSLNASNLASGTVPDARFPATLPAASGANLTALNASNLASGTVPDARFPATLPAVSGANLTALNAGNVSSGTLAVARGGTGATDSYGILRAGMHGAPVAYPALWWAPSTISGTVTSGTQATDFFPFLQVAAATNGQARLSVNVGSAGPVWPGGDNLVDYARKAVVRFRVITRLSAHADSKIAAHFAHTSVTSHTSYDRSVRGLSVVWVGGASAGTVYIQGHNGTTTTNSATASFPINDTTGYSWALEWEPGVSARLYRNGSLQCTLSTGLPTGTQGGSACGMLWLAGNTTNGTGNATLFRFMHADFLEVP